MTATLTVSNLSRTFGHGAQEVRAVRDVSFSIDAGSFVAIVGPSGSGKTTLLAMLGALLTPTSGTIEVDGQDIGRLGARQQARFRRDAVGYVFQSNNLVPCSTARENLLLVRRRSAAPRARKPTSAPASSSRSSASNPAPTHLPPSSPAANASASPSAAP
ncbi:MAG: ATP-binding cassette domain-containing protein [Dehalococcoidia bacterium]|nr:ATP-binding cassette domain-containing protein [Dehalococcoidia bacterium]